MAHDRPLTRDTEYFVCVWSHKGESTKSIAEDLDRSVKAVDDILDNAKKSGRYDRHIAKYNAYIESLDSRYAKYYGNRILI